MAIAKVHVRKAVKVRAKAVVKEIATLVAIVPAREIA